MSCGFPAGFPAGSHGFPEVFRGQKDQFMTHPPYTTASICITQRCYESAHLQTRHHLPFTVSATSPLLNWTVTRSKNIVNKSFMESFFTFSSGGASMQCWSSWLLSWLLLAYLPCESMIAMQVYHHVPHHSLLQAHHHCPLPLQCALAR